MCQAKILQLFVINTALPRPSQPLTHPQMLNKTAPGLSSENLFVFRVALTYPGSSSGLQIPLPVQHIPLSPCIRAHCSQGCVCASDTLLVPSWMSHLVTVLWPSLPRWKRTADQACPSPNLMEQLQGQKSYFFFPSV